MPQRYRHREESVNTQLAVLLTKHGVAAESETIQQSGQHRPDVMCVLGGLRIIIEGKFADSPGAFASVQRNASARIQSGICHLAVALVYPVELRSVPVGKLEKALSRTRLLFVILSETGSTDRAEGTPSEILSALRRVQDSLIKDDIVAESANRLSQVIDSIATLWNGQPAICDKLSRLLGMPPKRNEESEEREARRTTAAKVAALVLANAMIFQEQLAASNEHV
jgi:hypothetical protein